MATLDQLKTRIKLELNRDDMDASDELEQALADAIDRAIEFHADEQFWFNTTGTSANTSNGSANLSIPSAIRRVTAVYYNGAPLKQTRVEAVQGLASTGLPTHWAGGSGAIRLHPIPDSTYSLSMFGIAVETALSSGSSTNDWTTHGYDLIDATARKILLRDYLADPEGAAAAAAAEQEYLAGLRLETKRRRWMTA